MDKRSFLKNTITAAMGIGALPLLNRCVFKAKPSTGLQLYTLRDLMSVNPRKTLEYVAKVGYKELETAGYSEGKMYGLDPSEFHAIVTDLGMTMVSGHISFKDLKSDWGRVLQMLEDTGQKYVVFPYLEENERNLEIYHEVIELLNEKSAELRQLNKVMAYHNHAFEFESIDGVVPMELLLKETDAEVVDFELDIYWAVKAGASVLDLFKKYKNRFSLWHVKDMNLAGNFTEVGNGVIDFQEIFDQSQEAGMQHFFIEQDQSVNPEKSIATSFQNLQGLL
ncbi:MAG: sugar phosphate isomerase/epimerase [Cyclobacteriaceae bacterium]|nr:sugar phosphate isomerase/epimerase [Cyclobacteriaceae bacterium]